MSIVLFENNKRECLYPLNTARATADILIGIFTIRERWELLGGEPVFIQTQEYLSGLYAPAPEAVHLWIDASVLPDSKLASQILELKPDESLFDKDDLIAAKGFFKGNDLQQSNKNKKIFVEEAVKRLSYPWQIFLFNDLMLRYDFELISKRKSFALPENNQYVQPEKIFIEEGATINYSIVNASTGPVYIGKNALIMEGCTIRGPFAMGEKAVLKMGTQIYGCTTIGENCTGGGEIKNAVMQPFSNKGHYGYLGDAVIGRWCNLGAGTTNSNVKNTGSTVKMWLKSANDFVPVSKKCGMVMGDYSRTAINMAINTGSLIGICCHIASDALSLKYFPDFQWVQKDAFTYNFEKALSHISNWKSMKGSTLSEAEASVLMHIFEQAVAK